MFNNLQYTNAAAPRTVEPDHDGDEDAVQISQASSVFVDEINKQTQRLLQSRNVRKDEHISLTAETAFSSPSMATSKTQVPANIKSAIKYKQSKKTKYKTTKKKTASMAMFPPSFKHFKTPIDTCSYSESDVSTDSVLHNGNWDALYDYLINNNSNNSNNSNNDNSKSNINNFNNNNYNNSNINKNDGIIGINNKNISGVTNYNNNNIDDSDAVNVDMIHKHDDNGSGSLSDDGGGSGSCHSDPAFVVK